MSGLLIIQATPFCNIDCSYCYLPGRSDTRRISLTTYEAILQRVFDDRLFGDDFTLCWHAGEPLAAPVKFYRSCNAILQKIKPAGVTVRQNFQTNATLINDAWCDYFIDTQAHIGVSIDGPQFLHDLRRKDRNGRGTFERTMRGVETLRRRDIDFSAICVLTSDHLQHAQAIFELFCELEPTSVGFNIDEIEGENTASSFQDEDAVERLKHFVRALHSLNMQRKRPLRFSNLQVNLFGDVGDNQQAQPWRIVTVDADANVSTFSPELLGHASAKYHDFILGNLLTDSFEAIRQGQRFKTLDAAIQAGVGRCQQQCDYYRWCLGGAPANKFFEHGDFDAAETLYCRTTRKAFLDVQLEITEAFVADIMAQRTRTQPTPA